MEDISLQFQEILSNIKESSKSIKLKCTKCNSFNIEFLGQSLGFVDSKICDTYHYKCNDCNEELDFTSKPLKHFENIKPKDIGL